MRLPATRYSPDDGPPAVVIIVELERSTPLIGGNTAGYTDAERLAGWIKSHPNLQAILDAAYDAQGDAEPSEQPGDPNL
jgi:hypothetical protein